MHASSSTSPSSTSAAPTLDPALAHAAEHAPRFERELFELLRIPSVSTQPDHAPDCRAAAEWIAHDLDRIGMEHVRLLETGGHPVVYGDWLHAGAEAPTVLVYGHYDVQPPDPLELWQTPPFEPTLVDGAVRARGAADDKGQLFIHVKAVEAMLAAVGRLPVNVKFCIEGEEESGSEHLEALVERERELLACDVCVVSDTHMLSAEQPSIVAGLRGMAYCEVAVRGPAHDLHSGGFGGAVRNPAEALARILVQLKDTSGRILVPDFYDDVRAPDEAERAALAAVPFDEAAFLAEAGVEEGWGEAGWSAYERVGVRPTLEINGIWSGYTGAGAKTVLPAEARAKVSMRLVADQGWRHIAEQFAAHVRELAAAEPGVTSCEVTALHGGDPSLVDTDHAAMRAAARALEATFGREPAFTREGGSIPVVTTFAAVLGAPTLLMGFGLPDDRLHSPNEKFALAQLHRGIATTIRFHHEYAGSVSAPTSG